MEIQPADPGNSHSPYPVAPAAPPSSEAQAAGEELAVQTVSYVGYLMDLLNERNTKGDSAALDAEIKRVYALLQSQILTAEKADPNTTSLFNIAMSSSGLNLSTLFNSDGTINSAVALSALSSWVNQTNGSLPGAIVSFLNNGIFNPRSATDPNTLFAYFMMVKALMWSPGTLQIEGFEYDSLTYTMGNGMFSGAFCLSQFLAAYATANGISNIVSNIVTTGPYATGGSLSNAEFVADFEQNPVPIFSESEAFQLWWTA